MLTFIEVFAGCGGLSTGLTDAGWKPLLLVDNDKNCIETLKLNKSPDIVQQHDATKLSLIPYKNKVTLLAGGVPCQAFSQAGLRKGTEDPRGSLFNDFARFIKECEPHVFLVENVVGLLTHEKGETLKKVTTMLAGEDYDVTYQVLNALDYNVPQKRKRIFIVGLKRSSFKAKSVFTFPPPLTDKPNLRKALENCPQSDGHSYSENKRKIMEMVPAGGCWVDLPEAVQRTYLGGSFTSGGGKRGMARRLSWDEPSLTLTTSPCQKQTERCHPEETRPLTVREYARIQTFPDDYKFSGTVASQYKQIGNAVPIQLAFHVGRQLLIFCDEKLKKSCKTSKNVKKEIPCVKAS